MLNETDAKENIRKMSERYTLGIRTAFRRYGMKLTQCQAMIQTRLRSLGGDPLALSPDATRSRVAWQYEVWKNLRRMCV
jgi:hypothetical protein